MSSDRIIAIATTADDAHAARVEGILRARGASVLRIDHSQFARTASAAIRYEPGGSCRVQWRAGADAIDLRALTALWWRRPGRPSSALPDAAAAAFVESESRDFLDDLAGLGADDLAGLGAGGLAAVPQLPGPRDAVRRAQRKARQLAGAAALGFDVPPTLITNDPDELLAFAADHGALRLVSKQAGFTESARPAGSTDNADAWARYTERVTARDLMHVEALRHCPMIIQVEVPKRLELRVTVVGEQVFAVAIHSQQNPRTSLDWRRYDDRATRYEQVDLPADLADRCGAWCRAEGLRYSAFDFVLTPDGRYVFLEVNPNGQYLWLEDLTGAPISAAIADELLRPRPLPEETR